jgi:hypothetical protein
MKYLSKSFEYENNPNYTMFNTIIWENKYRAFTSDRMLSRVMARYQEDRPGVTWLTTDLENCHGDKRTVWQNPTLKQGVKS